MLPHDVGCRACGCALPVDLKSREEDQQRTCSLFARSQGWLVKVAQSERGRHASLDDTLKLLLGHWICEQAVSPSAPSQAFSHQMALTEQSLQRASKSGAFDPSQHDSKLMLLCYRILAKHKRHAPGIDEFALRLATALKELPSIPLRYVGEAVLLERLGYPCRLTDDVADEYEVSEYDLLRSTKDQLIATCDDIFAITRYGTLSIRGGASATWRRVLPVILCESLRQYDLNIATIVLRAICWLSRPAKNRNLAPAVDFISRQQQADGAFGRLAIEGVAVSRAKGSSFDLVTDLYLPTTLSCLWSLGEALVPTFSLFS